MAKFLYVLNIAVLCSNCVARISSLTVSCVCVLPGNLESLVESARFLLLLSKLYQQQNLYEERVNYMIKAKEVQDRYVLRAARFHKLLDDQF